MTKTNPTTTSTAAFPDDLTDRLRCLRDGLLTGLVERDIAIRLALIAALAGEHLLLIGPPGTAKSLIARRLHLAFAESTYFERLLTRFTVPEELFGPLSIKGLEEDRYERLTDGYLPTASIAFLDEIFKANSAILNALLTLLNEREFDNGVNRDGTPLIAAIGASNELPEGEELDALFDRFLLRLHVGPVSTGAFSSLLALRGESSPEVPEALRLTADDLAAVQSRAHAIAVPEDVVGLLCELREWCVAEGIAVSDRRWRKVVKLLQVAALTNGREAVLIWDCWLLQHCLWNEPEQQERLYEWYAARVGTSASMDPVRLTRIVVSWGGRLKHDEASRSQARDAEGRPLFKGNDGKPTTEDTGAGQAKRGREPLFLAPANAKVQKDGDYYSQWEPVTDRTNAGSGYTIDELDRMKVSSGRQQLRFQHWPDRETYLANSSNWHLEHHSLPPIMEPTRQKDAYVEDCVREIDELQGEVDSYKAQLEAHITSLNTSIRDHLWITPEFAGPASDSLRQTRREVETLRVRVQRLRQGFEMLPRESPGDLPTEDDGGDAATSKKRRRK